MGTKILNLGVISKENFRKRSIAIARGNYKPGREEPKVWFESIQSVSQVLSSDNQELLKTIIKCQPRSLTELEKVSFRKKSNLSRTLRTMERYGIVELEKIEGKLVPKVVATDFKVVFGLNINQ